MENDGHPSTSKEVNVKQILPENNEDTTTIPDILPGFKTFEEFRQAGFKTLMEATRNSTNLPSGHNWDYYTSFPSFKKVMDAEGTRVLELISMLLHHQGVKGNILRRDFEEKFDLIIDANDHILERVGFNLDEISGIRRNPEPAVLVEAVGSCTRPISGSWNVNRLAANNSDIPNPQPIRLLTAKNIQRPQIKFKDKIDNTLSPFEPRIKEKPNSLKPLSIMLQISEDGEESYSHPYEYELMRFSPPADRLKEVKPRMYSAVEDTPLVMVDMPDQLPGLLQDLAKYSEIAIDLEHHSYRSFQGFTCLMQISTRDTDYIIDTLTLRDKLHCLNEIFTKPTIVKVFHGADCDVEWLQRDLCLYVVNMFDTHQAAKALNFAQLSLAYLLKHYCNVYANKHFQLADWRIRPLPEELVMYARQDTHYLLYIYDMMNNALLDAANGKDNLLQSVFRQSTEICKTRYEKPALREDSHMLLYRRNKKLFDNRQLFALRELYRWRDKIARQEDESIGYVLPNHMMLQIAETLPREMQGILACCNPIPPLVRQNLLALHHLVLQARDQPLIKPILEEETRSRIGTQSWIKVNLDGALHCPHDLTYSQDFRNDLPTLLGGSANVLETSAMEIQMTSPTISVFEAELTEIESDTLNHITFVCPYERYKKMKPFVQSQEAEAAAAAISNKAVPTVNGDKQDVDVDNEQRIQRIKDHFMDVSSKRRDQEEVTDGKPDEVNVPTSIPSPELELVEDPVVELKPLRQKRPKKRTRPKKGFAGQKELLAGGDGDLHVNKKPRLEESVEITPTNNKKGKRKKKQHEEGFQPFDYSRVNFNRFQGGSKVPQVNQNVGGKPKGKKGKRSKKNNKSMTFGKGQW
ncbi:exosome complex component 10 homolog [Periplaneta americana]|uniref:exosome complex component 10 homolog n=1 Tax=Periplaneta americana TaxID=6978 RepID=UPI0037E87824